MTDAWLMTWSVLFGAIGLGFFTYGSRQRSPVPWLCGLALMVYPFFVANAAAAFGVGVVLTGIPYVLRG